jgi:hypothetical protein
MKQKLLLLFTCSAFFATAQNEINITKGQYDLLKKNHQLDLTKNYLFTDAVAPQGPEVKYTGQMRTPSSICSCMQPLDSTYSYVPFVNYIGTTNGNVYSPNNMNDDASSIQLNLPFTFNYYGVPRTSVFINNNGNISFNSPYSTFTANPFPDPSYNMIAPFWADVDTREFAQTLGSAVYYKITPTAMIVKWENVGYFDMHFDKLNTFQLIITDGTDTLLPAGKNVGFCYGDMAWTTGDITGGGGFGSPATVGVNQGNGADYFQVGTFNQPTMAFDGPYNNPDGIDWLDNQGMYFSTSASGNNIPPIIINNNICDTIDVYTGDTIRSLAIDSVEFLIGVATPEINQTLNISFSCTEPGAFSTTQIMNTPTYQSFNCKFKASNLPIGLYYVTVTATDDGTPAQQTVETIVIRSSYDPGTVTALSENNDLAASIQLYPNPNSGIFTLNQQIEPSELPFLTIYDLMGNKTMEKTLQINSQTIDMSGFSKGVYFATISTKNGLIKTLKVVLK